MATIVYTLKYSDKNLILQGESVEKWNIYLTMTQIKSHVNFGNNLLKAKAKKVRFYFVTQKWHRSICYVNWAILIVDSVV